MKFVNLTPHTIRIQTCFVRPVGQYDAENWWKNDRDILPSGDVARVATHQELSHSIEIPTLHELDGVYERVNIYEQTFGAIQGLPKEKENTILIVSAMVLSALKSSGSERNDVVAPNTSGKEVKRNKEGQILFRARIRKITHTSGRAFNLPFFKRSFENVKNSIGKRL